MNSLELLHSPSTGTKGVPVYFNKSHRKILTFSVNWQKLFEELFWRYISRGLKELYTFNPVIPPLGLYPGNKLKKKCGQQNSHSRNLEKAQKKLLLHSEGVARCTTVKP